MITAVDCTIIRLKKNIIGEHFFKYYSQSQAYFNSISENISGTTRDRISRSNLGRIPVPIPPLSEQHSIVAIFDVAFASIAKAKANAEQNLKNAKELFESYLQGVFKYKGDGWEEKKLGDICELIMGQSPPGESYNSSNKGVPLINGPVEFGKEPFSKTIKSKFTTEPTKHCKENDLILCVRGSTTGRINIAGFDACIGRGVAAVRYSKNQTWLNYYFLASRQKIFDLGTGATFPNVSADILKNLFIPLPPFYIQQSIIHTLDELSSKTKKMESIYQQKLNDLEELKKSIIQKAFNGELRLS
jgi:type I restriction enzyme, S subunit